MKSNYFALPLIYRIAFFVLILMLSAFFIIMLNLYPIIGNFNSSFIVLLVLIVNTIFSVLECGIISSFRYKFILIVGIIALSIAMFFGFKDIFIQRWFIYVFIVLSSFAMAVFEVGLADTMTIKDNKILFKRLGICTGIIEIEKMNIFLGKAVSRAIELDVLIFSEKSVDNHIVLINLNDNKKHGQ